MAEMLDDGGARGLVTGRSQAGLDATQEQLGKGGIAALSDACSLTDLDCHVANAHLVDVVKEIHKEWPLFDPE